jgi:uncharacterized membrane protein HdeD (DUF308 family)
MRSATTVSVPSVAGSGCKPWRAASGALALAIGLAQLHPFTATRVVVALIVTAAARALIPFFATDQGESRFQTLHGIIHMILAVIAFGGPVRSASSTCPRSPGC